MTVYCTYKAMKNLETRNIILTKHEKLQEKNTFSPVSETGEYSDKSTHSVTHLHGRSQWGQCHEHHQSTTPSLPPLQLPPP